MRGGMKKVNKNIFYLLTLSAKNNPFKSTRAAYTGCLHYNKVYTNKYGINSFKYQGVKILNDLKKINIYQNNVSKSKF